MINVIKKFFNTVYKVDESSVEFVVQVEEKTKQQLFDDAVKEVVKSKLSAAIFDQMTDMCYSKEQLDDTKAAIQDNCDCRTCDTVSLDRLKGKFPNMVYTIFGFGSYSIGTPFDLSRFVDKLLEDAL